MSVFENYTQKKLRNTTPKLVNLCFFCVCVFCAKFFFEKSNKYAIRFTDCENFICGANFISFHVSYIKSSRHAYKFSNHSCEQQLLSFFFFAFFDCFFFLGVALIFFFFTPKKKTTIEKQTNCHQVAGLVGIQHMCTHKHTQTHKHTNTQNIWKYRNNDISVSIMEYKYKCVTNIRK